MSRWAILALFLFAPVARGQVFAVTAGDSSLFDAAGASLVRYTPTSTDTFSGGIINNHLLFGFNHLMLWHGLLLDVGDQSEPFVLPSDFSPNSRIYGRGLSIRRTRKDEHGVTISDLRIFLGSESVQFGTPFLTTAKTTGTPLLFLSYTRQLSPKLRFESHEIFSSRQTALESISYDVGKIAQVAGTAGVGSNGKYLAAEIFLKRSWMIFRGAEIISSPKFNRITPEPFVFSQSENKGLNFQADFAPIPQHLHLTATHLGTISQIVGSQAVLLGQSSVASTSSSIGAFASAWHMTGSANIYEGSALGKKSTGSSLGAGFRFWKITEQSTYYKSNFGGAALGHMLQEVMSRHWSVSQFVTQQFATPQQAARTSFDGGFSWTSNLLTAQLDWQEQYSPITAALGRGAFQRVMAVTVSIRLPHSAAATVSANTDPTGKLRFSAYGSEYLYGSQNFGESRHEANIGKVLYTGKVLDANGAPIEGIAIKIGKDETWTDSEGVFTLRMKSAKDLVLAVDLDSGTAPGTYHIVSCPTTISASASARITLSRQ